MKFWMLRHPIQTFKAWRSIRNNPPGLVFIFPTPSRAELDQLEEDS